MSMIALLKQSGDTIGLYGGTIFISICVLLAVMIAILNLPWKAKELQQTGLEIEVVFRFLLRKIRSCLSRTQNTLGNLKRCLRPRRT